MTLSRSLPSRLLGLCLAMATWFGPAPAAAERLFMGLSERRIEVTSTFAGETIALFGVIERDAQTVSRRGDYELIVTVTGPPVDVLVQPKTRRFGLWVNGSGETFRNVPAYRAVLYTEDAGALLAPGEPAADLAIATLAGAGSRIDVLRGALADRQASLGLYRDLPGSISRPTRTFFHAPIPLPGVAPDGGYTVEAHLFADGVRLDVARTRFSLVKVGIEQELFRLSRERPLVYGVGVVALALVTSYVGGVVFRRN